MKTDIIERLRKIQRLANGGEGGEMRNAAALLERIARANGIDLAKLDEAVQSIHVVRIGTDAWRRQLFCQICWRRDRSLELWSTFGQPDRGRRRVGGRRRPYDAVKLVCNDAFFVEVVAAFEVLSRDYNRQRKALFRAFLAANDLLLEASADDEPRKPLSDAERRLLEDAALLSLVIKRSTLRKQIEECPAD